MNLRPLRGPLSDPAPKDASGGTGSWDAVAQSRGFARAGFGRLHVARGEVGVRDQSRSAEMEAILFAPHVDVQVYGGLADLDDVRDVLAQGARFAVIASHAAKDHDSLSELIEVFPREVILAVELRQRRTAVRWSSRTYWSDAIDFFRELDATSLAGVIVSDPAWRLRPSGLDLPLIEDLAADCECPVYVAGGIASLSVLRAIADRAVAGAIVGRAFLAGALDPFVVAGEFSS